MVTLALPGGGSSPHPWEVPGRVGGAEGPPGRWVGRSLEMQRNGTLFILLTCSSINFFKIFGASLLSEEQVATLSGVFQAPSQDDGLFVFPAVVASQGRRDLSMFPIV